MALESELSQTQDIKALCRSRHAQGGQGCFGVSRNLRVQNWRMQRSWIARWAWACLKYFMVNIKHEHILAAHVSDWFLEMCICSWNVNGWLIIVRLCSFSPTSLGHSDNVLPFYVAFMSFTRGRKMTLTGKKVGPLLDCHKSIGMLSF